MITEKKYGEWDPLRYIIRAAKARSLEVYPVFCVLACGHDEPAGVLLEHPEWGLRDLGGKTVGSLSPAHPQAREWVGSFIDEVVDTLKSGWLTGGPTATAMETGDLIAGNSQIYDSFNKLLTA